MADTLYGGSAHGATFYLPMDGSVRFRFGNVRAAGYVRSRGGALTRVGSGTRLWLPRGEHTLSLYDATLAVDISIASLESTFDLRGARR